MNLGLSLELKTIISNIELEKNKQKTENISNYKIPDPNWVVNFSSRESCLIVDILKSKSTKKDVQ